MDENALKEKLETIKDVHQGKRTPADLPSYLRQVFIEFPEILEFLDRNYSSALDQLEEERDGHPATPWEYLGLHFFGLGERDPVFIDLSRRVYEHWYEHQIEFELKQEKRTLHKGTPLHQLGLIWQIKRNDDKGRKYLLLALIEDIFKSLENPDIGPKQQGYRVLQVSYKLDDTQYDLISSSAKSAQDKRFPEDILYSITHGNNRLPTWEEISGITANWSRLKDELNEIIDGNFVSNTEKGKSYEQYVSRLLSVIDGILVKYLRQEARTSENKKKFEYDLILQNSSPALYEFGRYIPVECKLHKKKVQFAELVKFIYKVRNSRCKVGLMFTQSGVTGGKRSEVIKDSYFTDDITLIVLTLEDINNIFSSSVNLLQLLNTKYESIRFNF